MPFPGARVTARIDVLTSGMPSAAGALRSRPPVGCNAAAPGDSPRPLSTALSDRVSGSTTESLPSAAPAWPDAMTYSMLSSPTTANRAFVPVSGMESGVLTEQHSNDVNQLGPAGVEPTRLLLTTNTRVPTMATACG